MSNSNKIGPGILYWYIVNEYDKSVEMLVKTERNYRFYEHELLVEDGQTFVIHTTTENIEDDEFWKEYYERIEL